jgi:hypothetical protein
MTVRGRERSRPWSHWSSTSGLPTVADRPIRWSGRPASAPSRSSTARRCQPRSSPAKACTSSTTTARRSPNMCGASSSVETSIASSDSGVVSRTEGRDVACRWRAPAAVSPWRTLASRPSHPAYVASRGSRLLSSALRGHTYSTDRPGHSSSAMRVRSGSIAASVLPPAVAATSSASSPRNTGTIDAVCSGRSPGQPSELTTWCCTTGCSRSKDCASRSRSVIVRQVEVDTVEP